MKLTNEQIEAILDGAPEGATHYTGYPKPSYQKADGNRAMQWVDGEWYKMSSDTQLHSLDDLREILELRQGVERLRNQRHYFRVTCMGNVLNTFMTEKEATDYNNNFGVAYSVEKVGFI